MSSKKEQTTTRPTRKTSSQEDMTPRVTFDRVNKFITAEVVIAQPKAASTPTILAPLISVPVMDTWTLVWELRVLPDAPEVQFADPGVVLPNTLPRKVTILAGPTGTEAEWTVQLANKALTGTSFKYEIVIKSASWTGKKQAKIVFFKRSSGDPTRIQDPVDPPATHSI